MGLSAVGRAAFYHTKNSLKEGFVMKGFWNTVQMVFAAVGGWLGWFLGGCDGLLYALVALDRKSTRLNSSH